MGLPEDLKNYGTDNDGFQLIEPQTAGALLLAALFAVLVLERMGVL